jgi:hypothetical protein
MLHVLVLKDENCAACDEVMQQLDHLKSLYPKMHIRQRLLEEEPEVASRLGVVATPAMIVNGQLAFQGRPDPQFLRAYLNNVEQGLHDNPDAYPPDDERDAENQGQEATGSMDPAYRGSGRSPSFGSSPGGRH